jgi:hypothetical protein
MRYRNKIIDNKPKKNLTVDLPQKKLCYIMLQHLAVVLVQSCKDFICTLCI